MTRSTSRSSRSSPRSMPRRRMSPKAARRGRRTALSSAAWSARVVARLGQSSGHAERLGREAPDAALPRPRGRRGRCPCRGPPGCARSSAAPPRTGPPSSSSAGRSSPCRPRRGRRSPPSTSRGARRWRRAPRRPAGWPRAPPALRGRPGRRVSAASVTRGSGPRPARRAAAGAPGRARGRLARGEQQQGDERAGGGDGGRDEHRDLHALDEREVRGVVQRLARDAADGVGDRARAGDRVVRGVAGAGREALRGAVHAVTVVAGEHGSEDGHAQRAADLTDGVVEGRADARALRGQRAHDRVGRRRHREPDAEAEDRLGAADQGERRVRRGGGVQRQAAGDDREAAGDDELRAEASAQLGAERTADGEAGGDGERPDAGLERAEAVHALQVLGREEQDAEQAEEGEADRAAGGGEARVAEQTDVEHRGRGAQLPGGEQAEDRDGGGERADDGAGGPAAVGGLDDGPQQRGQAERGQRGAGQVDAVGLRVARLGDEDAAGGEGEDGDRDVDEEDPVPVGVLDEPAARDRAERDAEAGDGRPGADRLRPLLGGEDGREDREGGRHDQRAADAHERAAGDELGGGAGERGEDGAACEDEQAGGQGARLRPKRSPSDPAVSSRPAKTSM